MRYQELFSRHGFVKRPDGKWVNPATGKGMRSDLAKNKVAKLEGFDSYKELQNVSRTKRYKKFAEWFEKAQGTKPGTEYNKFYAKAKTGKRGEALVELLRATTFNPNFQKEGYWKNYL